MLEGEDNQDKDEDKNGEGGDSNSSASGSAGGQGNSTEVVRLAGQLAESAQQIATATRAVGELQEANKMLAGQVEELLPHKAKAAELTGRVATLEENTNALSTQLEEAKAAAIKAEDTALVTRREQVATKYGIDSTKVTNMTPSQLDAVEQTHAPLGSSAKGMDLNGGGGGKDIAALTSRDAANSVIEGLKNSK